MIVIVVITTLPPITLPVIFFAFPNFEVKIEYAFKWSLCVYEEKASYPDWIN